jgi:hypothetical protein
MAPVVRIEPNGLQALLSHDDVVGDIVAHGWEIFIRRFEGYNLDVSQANIGDLQLEVTEESIAQAKRLSQEGERW